MMEEGTEGPAPEPLPAGDGNGDNDGDRPGGGAGEAGLVNLVQAIQGQMEEGFERLLGAFQDKLAYDKTKDEQVARLHKELQDYKRDLVARTADPLVNGLVRLHDDLGKTAEALRENQTRAQDSALPERICSGFQEDIEILLENSGVTCYHEENESFDPRRQQALRTVATDQNQKHGLVAERVRPGFERGDKLIRKEKVAVFKYLPGQNEKLQENPGASEPESAGEDPKTTPAAESVNEGGP